MRNDQRGGTAVEFAVIAAILFVILFAILEFSFIFLQEHYVANAAREGLRVGVRANNFNCFDGIPASTDCKTTTDRQKVAVNAVRTYLGSLYGSASIIKPVAGTGDVSRDPTSLDAESKILTVEVEVNNFFPPILSSLAALLPGTGFELKNRIRYTARGEYEDPSEP